MNPLSGAFFPQLEADQLQIFKELTLQEQRAFLEKLSWKYAATYCISSPELHFDDFWALRGKLELGVPSELFGIYFFDTSFRRTAVYKTTLHTYLAHRVRWLYDKTGYRSPEDYDLTWSELAKGSKDARWQTRLSTAIARISEEDVVREQFPSFENAPLIKCYPKNESGLKAYFERWTRLSDVREMREISRFLAHYIKSTFPEQFHVNFVPLPDDAIHTPNKYVCHFQPNNVNVCRNVSGSDYVSFYVYFNLSLIPCVAYTVHGILSHIFYSCNLHSYGILREHAPIVYPELF